MRKTIRSAPKFVFSEILKELEELEMVKKINKHKILIKESKELEKQLKRLKENIFPISP